MRKRWLVALVAGLAGLAAAASIHAAADSPGARQVALRGTYAGRLDMLVRPTGFQLVSWASGRATLLGNSEVMGTGPADRQPGGCWVFASSGSLIAGDGARIHFVSNQQRGCRTTVRGNTFRGSGTLDIVGGSGRFARARGRLRYVGSGNSVRGDFSATVTGNISY